MIRKFFFISFLLFSCKNENRKEIKVHEILNKMIVSVQNSDDPNFSVKELEKAYALNNKLQNDTIKSRFYRQIACEYYNLGLLDVYYIQTKANINFCKQIGDSLTLGKLYYDLGDFFYEKNSNDSSYYFYHKALKSISIVNKEKIRTQFNIAKLLLNENQLIESEVQLFKTITYAKEKKDYHLLYECYSILGGVQNGLKNYKEALKSYRYSKIYLDKIFYDKQYATLLCENYNNIANVYLSVKAYTKAIEFYNKGLKTGNIRKNSPKVYAVLIDNLAYTKLQNRTLPNPNKFFEALQIRDSLQNKLGVIMSQKRIGEYYSIQKDSTKALKYYTLAFKTAVQTRSFNDQLTLLKLQKLVNPKKAVEYQDYYIKLSDSLLKTERNTRNKFTKIEYETDQIVQEKKILTKRMNFILLLGTLFFLLLTVSYILYKQKVKYRVLILEQEQQRSNEEVYKLLLTQQQEIEQGKAFEKKRISTELHDGVVSKLFGIRIHLERLIYLDKKIDLIKVEDYLGKLNELENEIRVISHRLSENAVFNKEGFLLIIQNFITDYEELSGIKIQLINDSSINWENLNYEQKINLFRIIQESFNNIRKYAQAEKVVISFKAQNDLIVFSIADDGIGFDFSKNSSGIGLKNIQIRIENLKGSFDIKSNEKGTSIIGNFPLIL